MVDGNMIIDFMNLREGVRHLNHKICNIMASESKFEIEPEDALFEIRQAMREFNRKNRDLYEN